jgi:hypothetical protein
VTQEKIALDDLEHRMSDWWTRHKSGMRVGLKGLTGLTLCCTGTHFGRCVILFHSLRVTGWPSFKRAVEEIGHSYQRARQVVKASCDLDQMAGGGLLSVVGHNEIETLILFFTHTRCRRRWGRW